MSVLDQCMGIIQLTSLDWSSEERYGLIGHSFRVMGKAGNYDELVVGMMHALYAASSYTRWLYRVDVDGDPEWKTALDLFVPPQKVKRSRAMELLPDEYLLNFNMQQGLSDEDRLEWMLKETVWSSAYEDYIRNVSCNRIARNVMIHKLEDMLEVLRNPGKYENESGKQYYFLPWKKHYVVDSRQGSGRIPKTDDALLLRDPTELERKNLIDKYSKALCYLGEIEERFSEVWGRYSSEERQEHEQGCTRWFISWMKEDKSLMEEYGDEKLDFESEEMPF